MYEWHNGQLANTGTSVSHHSGSSLPSLLTSSFSLFYTYKYQNPSNFFMSSKSFLVLFLFRSLSQSFLRFYCSLFHPCFRSFVFIPLILILSSHLPFTDNIFIYLLFLSRVFLFFTFINTRIHQISLFNRAIPLFSFFFGLLELLVSSFLSQSYLFYLFLRCFFYSISIDTILLLTIRDIN